MRECVIPASVYRNYNFLRNLSTTKSESKRRKLLKMATDEQFYLLGEICFNYRTGDFRPTKRQMERLAPYADLVRRITSVKTSNGARRLLVRKGGDVPNDFFAALLRPVLLKATDTGSIKDDSESE